MNEAASEARKRTAPATSSGVATRPSGVFWIIALWLGHEQLSTTHGYLEADLDMKKETLAQLKAPTSGAHAPKPTTSNVLAFLEAL